MFLPSLEEIHIIELVELHRELHCGLDLHHAGFRAGGGPVSNDWQQNCGRTEKRIEQLCHNMWKNRRRSGNISTLKLGLHN